MSCYGKNEYGQLGDGSLVTRGPAQPPRVWLLSGRGDADCDADITSLDATMVLQDVAGLIGELPCPKAAMALDQTISSNDALLILQFVAGLLS